MKRSLPVVAAIACLVIGFGIGWWSGPGPDRRLCDDCATLVALQSKSNPSAYDGLEIRNLKAKLVGYERAMAESNSQKGDPPDLHPECECACHRYWLGPPSAAHDELDRRKGRD